MKVVQYLPALNIGGVETGVIDLSRALVSQGHESIVISGGGSKVSTIEKDGGKHYTIPKFAFLKLIKIYQQEKPDIVHIRSRKPAWTNAMAYPFLAHRPLLVSTFHGMYQYPFISQAMARVDHMIAVSQAVKQYILDSYSVNPDNISTIYRGCNPEKFNTDPIPESWKSEWYQSFPQTKNKKLLLLPARLSRWKGHEHFIDLIHQLSDDDRIHGLVVGPVSQSKQRFFNELKQKIHTLGIDDRITFTGGRDDIEYIYRLSDIAFNLSITPEPFGRTTVEAISSGTQFIGWRHGGTQEILERLFEPGLVDLHNLSSLVQTTRHLLQNPQIRPKKNDFLSDTMISETIHLYKKLLSQTA